MNGWISIIFSVLGGIALLMKSKTDENGGGGFTVVQQDGDTPAPSPSNEDLSNVSVQDVIDDPSLLESLKIEDPEKYEEITRTIVQNPSYMNQYVRQSKYYNGSQWISLDNKENEVLKLIEEGFRTEYVGRSLSGEYWIEVFTKNDPNLGWNSADEKVGITTFVIMLRFPEEDSARMMRDFELADSKGHYWNHYVQEFNDEYAVL